MLTVIGLRVIILAILNIPALWGRGGIVEIGPNHQSQYNMGILIITPVKYVHSIQHPPTCKVLPKICEVNFDPIVCRTGNNVGSQTKEEKNTITLK